MIPEEYKSDDYAALSRDVAYDMERFKEPYVVGAMIHRLVEERKLTNALFKQLNDKLDRIAALLEKSRPVDALSEVDQQIIGLVENMGRVTAADVQKELNYRGLNAASARLNALHRTGLLAKQRAGKKVFYARGA
jgi:uncharacterized membrane protein